MSIQPQISPEEMLLQARKTRNYLWVVFGSFLLISMIVAASASSQEVYEHLSQRTSFLQNPVVKHILYVGLAGVVAFACSMIPTRKVKEWVAPLILVSTIGFSIYLQINPVTLNGESRWVSIGFATFQPSELFKLSLIMLFGLISISFYKLWGPRKISQQERNRHYLYLRLALVYYLVGIGYYTITSLSVGVICSLFCFLYLFAIKAPLKVIKTIFGIYAVFILIVFVGVTFFGEEVTKAVPRMETWVARISRSNFGAEKKEIPFDSIFDENRQEKYALMAASRGWSQGFGGINSSELRHKLPMANSDYVLAIIIEEYGLLGFLMVSGLYIGWFVLAGRVMLREGKMGTTRDTADMRFFRRTIAAGIGILVPTQALMNMVVVSGFIVTGQNLPLLSAGGSSLVLNGLAMGLLMGIANEQIKKAELEVKASQERISLDLVKEETSEPSGDVSTTQDVVSNEEQNQ